MELEMGTDQFAQAREDGLRDWREMKVRHLHPGSPPLEKPAYYPTQIFYPGGGSLAHTDASYCASYNIVIQGFLEKYGIPDWAPVKRVPNAAKCLAYLEEQGQPFSEFRE